MTDAASGVRLMAAVLSRGSVSTQWALGFREMVFPEGTKVVPSYGHSVADQRNDIVRAFLAGGHTHLFFLDDDVLAPPETVSELLKRGLPIVSGLYYMRGEPLQPVAGVSAQDGKSARPVDFKVGQLVEVDFSGAGCLLIQRKVLEGMEYPWFRYDLRRTDLPPEERISEDGFFIQKAKRHGWKAFLDAGVRCLHLGMGRAELGGVFSPLAAGPVAPAPGFSTGPIRKWIPGNRDCEVPR